MDIAWMRALVEYWHNLKLSATRDAVKIALGIKPFCKSKDGQTQRNLLNFQGKTSLAKTYIIQLIKKSWRKSGKFEKLKEILLFSYMIISNHCIQKHRYFLHLCKCMSIAGNLAVLNSMSIHKFLS